MLKKQIFLSHNWGYDDFNRDNHERVNKLIFPLGDGLTICIKK